MCKACEKEYNTAPDWHADPSKDKEAASMLEANRTLEDMARRSAPAPKRNLGRQFK